MRSSRTLALLAVGFAAVLALGACGGDDDDDATGGDDTEENGDGASSDDGITLETTEFAFSPDSITIEAGEAVTVTLENKGAIEHDFTVEELDDLKVVTVGPAKTASGELTVDEAGEYTIYCSVPGHRAGGMEGTLVVE